MSETESHFIFNKPKAGLMHNLRNRSVVIKKPDDDTTEVWPAGDTFDVNDCRILCNMLSEHKQSGGSGLKVMA